MILRGDIMDKILQLLKELCSHCESNLNECNKGCAFRSLSNEHCEEYEKLKEGIEKLKEKHNEKMVLVIDKPNECSECPCFYDYLRCQAEEDAKVYGEKRPYNCPLKPMPKRKLALFDPNHCDMEEEIKIIHEINGYNRCIDEILGGK